MTSRIWKILKGALVRAREKIVWWRPASAELQAVVRAFREGHKFVFVHGGAGSGKSTLIEQLERVFADRRIVKLAPTGVAALNIRGQTIHSFCLFRGKVLDRADIQQRLDTIYSRTDMIIVDEISMVRADLFDALDQFLRVNRGSEAPFGGVDMIVVGDLYQLPPVVAADAREEIDSRYRTSHFFGAACMARLDLVYVEMTRNYRQKDEEFLAMLTHVRHGEAHASLARLNENVRNCPQDAIVLASTNRKAQVFNAEKLEAQRGEMRVYKASVEGHFPESDYPVPPQLELKAGARVMLAKNDPARRWVNGSTGTLRKLLGDRVIVRLDSGGNVLVEPVIWEKVRYRPTQGGDDLHTATEGRFTQLPIKLAWAVTIHKSQGCTLDRAHVDLGARAFAPGQVYVALSRCRSLKGLTLERKLEPADLFVDPAVVEFERSLAAGSR